MRYLTALLAAACVVVGRLTERDVDGMNLLGAAVIMMIMLDPVLPWRVSAQLSIGGVAGILLLTQPLTTMLERVSSHAWYPASAPWLVARMMLESQTQLLPAMVFQGCVKRSLVPTFIVPPS